MDTLSRGMGYCFISKPQLTATNMRGFEFQMCGWEFKKPMKEKTKNQIMVRSETLVIV
jgi:hypothetical protein